jgi:hypothetical protein
VWACGIIYVLGQINFLSDKATQPYMTMADVCAAFSVGQSTASAKAHGQHVALVELTDNVVGCGQPSRRLPFPKNLLGSGCVQLLHLQSIIFLSPIQAQLFTVDKQLLVTCQYSSVLRSHPKRCSLGGFPMTAKAESEARLLSAAELEIVNVTRDPEIGQLSSEQLKAVGRRLRQAHDRAKDISARQQREMRGKADPHGAKPAHDNTGTMAKVQVLFEAIQRLDAELSRREEVNTATPSQAALSRHALELKLSSKADQHPDPGRSASEGMKTKKRQTPTKIGTTKKEIGRVSQAGKVAQARKDTAK